MMRSSTAPRIHHDATVKFETGGGIVPAFDARAVNLSVGGLFVAAPTLLAPGVQVDLQVSLRDGGAPVQARGEVVWVQEGMPEAEGDAARGMALRFVDLEEKGAQRIERLVDLRSREPTGLNKRDLRIHLPSLQAPLRAVARDQTERGLMLEAELPWLSLGTQVMAELSPERVMEGVVRWVGLDVTRAGNARLRILVETVDATQRPPAIEMPTHPVRRAQPPQRRRSPLIALGVMGAMAVAAGTTALVLRPAPATTVLALPAPSEAPPATARPPVVVAVPQAQPPAPPLAEDDASKAPLKKRRKH